MGSCLYALLLFQLASAQWSQDIALNSFQLPVITLCQKYTLLLDTGSKDTWIADSSCKDCPQKISICPQSHTVTQQIKYFKGSIKGDLSFITTCLGSYKIICATQAQGMEAIGTMGILGLRGNHTGKNVIRTLLSNHNIKQHSFSLYYGLKENTIFFGEVPHNFISEQLQLLNGGKEWHIKQIQMKFWGLQVRQQASHQIFVDTGSNVLILPTQIYDKVKNIADAQMNKIGCFSQPQSFEYVCLSLQFLEQTVVFQLSAKSFVSFELSKTHVLKDGKHKLLIESGIDEAIIIGGSLLKQYILSFSLDGKVKIFIPKKGLIENEINNFKIILLEYVLIVVLLAFVCTKVYQIVELTLNRKIVI